MSSYIDELYAVLAGTRIVDLSHALEVGMPAWPTQARYGSVLYESYDRGDAAVHSMIVLSEHTGTHIDAPMHFVRGAATVDELPALLGRLVAIDASHLGPRELLPVEFIRQFENVHGAVAENDIVVFRFGWDDKWALQPGCADFMRDWPGLSEDCARHLADRRVAAVGTDALSPDGYGVERFVCHEVLLGAGIPILENVANIAQLPPLSFAVGLANKFRGGSGSPIRLLALVPAHAGRS